MAEAQKGPVQAQICGFDSMDFQSSTHWHCALVGADGAFFTVPRKP